MRSPEITRRLAIGVALVALALIGWLGFSALEHAVIADRCAEELVRAASGRDQAWLSEHVRSPNLRETLMSAHRVELLLVRPESSDWSRIALAVRATATSTRARAIDLLVANEERCTLILDYEGSR